MKLSQSNISKKYLKPSQDLPVSTKSKLEDASKAANERIKTNRGRIPRTY